MITQNWWFSYFGLKFPFSSLSGSHFICACTFELTMNNESPFFISSDRETFLKNCRKKVCSRCLNCSVSLIYFSSVYFTLYRWDSSYWRLTLSECYIFLSTTRREKLFYCAATMFEQKTCHARRRITHRHVMKATKVGGDSHHLYEFLPWNGWPLNLGIKY